MGNTKDLDLMLSKPRRVIHTMVVLILITMAVVSVNQFADMF